tara:strand:+ start:406 stop:2301 length:1896 start_codon:yes stop_codon:yes gene_type:complete
MATGNRNIVYVNRDFESIRSQLINYSQTYFPNTYTDFSETSPGMMFIEQASYVSDVLSFYLDNQIQETYLQYAQQTENIFQLAYMFGYKPKVTGLATVTMTIYQQVPAKTEGGAAVPDYSYALLLPENTSVSSNNGTNFIIQDQCDFSVSNSLDPTEVTIASVSSNEPNYYLLKKTRTAVSGQISSETYTMGAYQQFPTLNLSAENIADVVEVYDSEGNNWYEVDYLAQDLIYDGIKNTNTNDPNNFVNSNDAPYVLQTVSTNRRFVTRFTTQTNLQIQFGAGQPLNVDEEVIPNPDNVGLGLPFEEDKLTTAYSPTNFVFTNTYGIAPSNTTITVRYLTGGGTNSNIQANALTRVSSGQVVFATSTQASAVEAQYVFNSLVVNNPSAASGGQDGDTVEEIRQNALGQSNTQLRNVTADDYLIRSLSMPARFGVISKALTQKPNINNPDATLCIYVLTKNSNGNLTAASDTLKTNLQTYLNQYRMIGDVLDIKDAYVINIAVNFQIVTLPNYNNSDVIAKCTTELQNYFNIEKWQINQPIILKDLTVLLDKVAGVQTVQNISITNKAGTSSGYSQYAYDILGATQGGIIYPSLDPSIFEIAYPGVDIQGKVVSLGAGSYAVGGGLSGVGSY